MTDLPEEVRNGEAEKLHKNCEVSGSTPAGGSWEELLEGEVKEMLKNQLGMTGKYWIVLACIWLFLDYQLIPSTAIGMYWYVGAMHYMMPHAAVLVAIALHFDITEPGS